MCEVTIALDRFVRHALKAAPHGTHVDEHLPNTATHERQQAWMSRALAATRDSDDDGDEENGGPSGEDGSNQDVAAAGSQSGGGGGSMLGTMLGFGNPLAALRSAFAGANAKWANVEVDVDPEFASWLTLTKTGDPREAAVAQLLVSIELLPLALADDKAAGVGQAAPNAYPELPPPADRGKCSLSAAGIMRYVCSNKLVLACCCCVGVVVIIIALVALLPFVNLLKETLDHDLPAGEAVPIKWALLVLVLLLLCCPPFACYVHFVGCCGYCGSGRMKRKRVFIRGFAATPEANLSPVVRRHVTEAEAAMAGATLASAIRVPSPAETSEHNPGKHRESSKSAIPVAVRSPNATVQAKSFASKTSDSLKEPLLDAGLRVE
jgi:hypothetical protein